eukprot:3781857-Pyramimonas_sp.AAC.1
MESRKRSSWLRDHSDSSLSSPTLSPFLSPQKSTIGCRPRGSIPADTEQVCGLGCTTAPPPGGGSCTRGAGVRWVVGVQAGRART